MWSLVLLLSGCATQEREPRVDAPGAPTTATTDALKAGAAVLQANAPLHRMDVFLVGFHPMKDDPGHQMEAHHFCRQVNEDFAQCVLFDGNDAEANLNGVEYIISEHLFASLPDDERPFWHPHNYEILSGTLVAPGLPSVAEHELMKRKMNSYGKTWHTWATGEGQELPLGPARLAWSFNADGEVRPELVARRDRALDVDTRRTRAARADLVELARPQHGVDTLAEHFPDRRKPEGIAPALSGD